MKTIRVSKDISLKVYTRKDGYAVGLIELKSEDYSWFSSRNGAGGVQLGQKELEKLIAGLKKAQGEFARKADTK